MKIHEFPPAESGLDPDELMLVVEVKKSPNQYVTRNITATELSGRIHTLEWAQLTGSPSDNRDLLKMMTAFEYKDQIIGHPVTPLTRKPTVLQDGHGLTFRNGCYELAPVIMPYAIHGLEVMPIPGGFTVLPGSAEAQGKILTSYESTDLVCGITNTTAHFFIFEDDKEAVQFGWDTDIDAAHIVSKHYRRLNSVVVGATFPVVFQRGNEFSIEPYIESSNGESVTLTKVPVISHKMWVVLEEPNRWQIATDGVVGSDEDITVAGYRDNRL